MKRLILCFIFSWACFIYGEDHQSVSLSWRPSLTTNFNFKMIGAGLEYTQQMDAFKWGVGLEYPSYRHNPTAFLSLQGAWVFQRQSQWMAVLGLKLSGGASFSEYWQESIMLYTPLFISFEYFLDEKFSLFLSFAVLVDPFEIFGGFKKPLEFEIPVGVSFYF